MKIGNKIFKVYLITTILTSLISCKKDKDEKIVLIPNISSINYNIDTSQYPLFYVSFSIVSENASHYEWEFGDGGTSSEKNPVHIYQKQGTYKVCVTAKGENEQKVKSETTLILSLPNVISASFEELNSVIIREVEYSSDTTVYDHVAFPDIAKLSDGRYIVVWREATEHMQNGHGKIMKSFGSSDGLTWTPAELLYDDPNKDDRDYSINRLSDGRLIGCFFKSGDGKTYINYSYDNGLTFTEPVAINTLPGWAVPSSQVVEINNTLWLPTYGNDNSGTYNGSRVIIFKSDDNGNTWSEAICNGASNSNVNLQEPAIINLDNNRLLMHTRCADISGYLLNMRQSVSTDGGQTWSNWKSFNFIGHAPELYLTESGVLISAFRWINSSATYTYTGMIYSINKGETWSNVIKIDDSDAETGYPAIESLGNDKFIIVYYRTEYIRDINNQIISAKWQIKAKIYKCKAIFANNK